MEDENKEDEQTEDEPNTWREQLKEMARTNKISLKELAVLGVGRDPFLCGSEKQVKMGKWFRDIINTYFKHIFELHLRRVHYYISQKARVNNYKGTGIYLNTFSDWVDLEQSALFARYLGYVDCGIFVDRRNPPTQVYSLYHQHTDIEEACKALPDKVVTNINTFNWNVQHVQPYHIEIWAEKSTMNDILVPLCMKYRCIYVHGLGELSLTKVMPELFDRMIEARKPCRIFYISDFDPAGERMPRSISRKIEWCNRDEYQDDFDIKL
ncbi:MAG: hypothetical protein MUP55_02455, partial [Candidatus Aenigmarchaeota archaeon]|nr:hypothetical protein [Candidatus Aenigmarchaeota archaeon]